jgi:citrate lyase subunit gamma (acyl carrier protein)
LEADRTRFQEAARRIAGRIIETRIIDMAARSVKILREARAGLEDRGDVVVCVSPEEEKGGIQLEIESTLISMFGDQIRASVLAVVEEYGLQDVKMTLRDQGALDYAIRARVQTALERAIKEGA